MRKRLPLIFVFILSACASAPIQATTPAPLVVAYSPALRPLRLALEACRPALDSLALIPAEKLPAEDFPADLWLAWGEPETLPELAAPLASEELVIVLNAANPVQSLTIDEIEAIFNGQISNWSAVGGEEEAIQVWAPVDAAENQALFAANILAPTRLAPEARLAPTLESMVTALATDPTAVGALPRAWVTDELRSISLSAEETVYLLGDAPPSEEVIRFIACLQGGIIQTLPGGYTAP